MFLCRGVSGGRLAVEYQAARGDEFPTLRRCAINQMSFWSARPLVQDGGLLACLTHYRVLILAVRSATSRKRRRRPPKPWEVMISASENFDVRFTGKKLRRFRAC